MSVDDQFEEIAQEMSSKASAVKCSIPEYIQGLKYIIDSLEVSIEWAEQDLKAQEI